MGSEWFLSMTLEKTHRDICSKEKYMKIILEENDRQYIDKINSDPEMSVPFYDENGSYSINFTIVDKAKANNFLQRLFYDKDKHFQEQTGIDITSLNLYTAVSTQNVKDGLRDIIKNIELEEERLKGQR